MDQQDTIYFDGKFEKIHGRIDKEKSETDRKFELTRQMIDTTNQSINTLDRESIERVRRAHEAYEKEHYTDGKSKDVKSHETKYHDWAKFWKMIGAIVSIAAVVGTGLLWVLNKIIHEAVKNGGTP